MNTPVMRRSGESVVRFLHIEFDEEYLQSVLDEFNSEHAKQLTLDEAKEYLANHIMDDTYYSFKNWLEGEGQ